MAICDRFFSNDPDFNVRVAAAIALVRLDDPRGIEMITACLNSENRKDREHAISALSGPCLKSAALVAPLIGALNDPSIRVRMYAAGALGHIGNPAAVEALLGKLSDKENLLN